MKTKICRVCQKRKSIKDFQKRETGVLRNECKECHNEYQRMRYLEQLGKFKRTVRAEKREADPKRCIKCGETKSLDEFGWHNRNKGQHRNMCKDCSRIWLKEYNKSPKGQKIRGDYREQYKGRMKELQKLYRDDPVKRKASKKYHRKYWLMKQFGITPDDYDRMLKDQNSCCAICGSDKSGNRSKNFMVDHNHETGKVRGLLCYRCNQAIGAFKDNSILLRKAADYLETFQPKT